MENNKSICTDCRHQKSCTLFKLSEYRKRRICIVALYKSKNETSESFISKSLILPKLNIPERPEEWTNRLNSFIKQHFN